MWYFNIMSRLLEKLPAESRNEGDLFLKNLFKAIKEVEDKPELEFYLGLIEKSFSNFEDKEAGSITLTEFSRYLLGLTLLYIKSNNDERIWNADFIPELSAIQEALDFNNTSEPAILTFINAQEKYVFANLKYNININYVYLSSVINENSDFGTIQSFIAVCKELNEAGSPQFKELFQSAEPRMVNFYFGALKTTPPINFFAQQKLPENDNGAKEQPSTMQLM